MRSRYTVTSPPGGITEKNRAVLTVLHRRFPGPFSATDAAAALSIGVDDARQRLARLASRGWLARVRQGLYTAPPMDASFPREWREDAWLVAAKVFSPGYIGGWSAAEHWDLTEQVFRDVFVLTTRRVKKRTQEIQGTVFRIKVIKERKLFGTRNVWRSGIPVQVSDASRTLVDVLDEPAIGGGINHVAGMVGEYFRTEARADEVLVGYVRQFGNGAVFKRLGYLVETLGIDAPEVVKTCMGEKTTGISALDPAISGGVIRRRWNLRIGVRLAGLVA